MSSATPPRPASLVVVGGLVAGACDIVYASLYWWLKAGVPAMRVCQSVAAGLLGREAARAGGWPTALLGLALHFGIALTMAATYFLVARRWLFLTRRPGLAGALYGALLYAIMRFVVVPLSAAGGGGGGNDPWWVGLSIAVHVLLIGVPIGYFSGRAAATAAHPR